MQLKPCPHPFPTRSFTPFEAFLQMPPAPASHPKGLQVFVHLCPLPVSLTWAGYPALGMSLPCKQCPSPTASLPLLHII